MRGKIFTLFLLSLVVFATSCNEDVTSDLDDLQSQIDELNTKLDEVEAGQQQGLLDAIAALEASIKAIETDSDDNYDGLLEDLQGIEDEIANNSSAIYYGNLLTQADYDAYTTQGATIVTGKVVASTAAQVTALADVKIIGGSLEISVPSAVTLASLTSVGEDLWLSGITGDVAATFAALGSVGGDVWISENEGLTSFSADNLVLINGGLVSEYNKALTTLSFAKLDMVNSIFIDEENTDNFQNYMGAITSIDLSFTDVAGDVYITKLGIGGDLTIGEVDGDLICIDNGLNSIEIVGETINGDFTLDNNAITSLKADNLTRVEGAFTIKNSYNTYEYDGDVVGLETMPAFDKLVYIGGIVDISNNNALVTMESFNSVVEINDKTFGVYQITFSNNGQSEFINVFNALETTFPYSNQYININVGETTNWFNGFNSLTKAQDLLITINAPGEVDGGAGVRTKEAINDVAKLEGFDALTEAQEMFLTVKTVTEFDAFGALEKFTAYNNAHYLSIYMPADETMDLCSMTPIFTKITNGDYDLKKAPRFQTVAYEDLSTSDGITQLTDDCDL
ncbi:hypothetical protein [Reichenbachiella sp.]